MNSRQVRAALMERGTNYRQWALARRYEPRMVVYAVNTYAGTQRRPRGLVTHRILRDQHILFETWQTAISLKLVRPVITLSRI